MKINLQGGEFKSKALENWQFFPNGSLYGKIFFPDVLEHSFVYLFCLNNFCLKLASTSQLPKQSRVVDFLCQGLHRASKGHVLPWLEAT